MLRAKKNLEDTNNNLVTENRLLEHKLKESEANARKLKKILVWTWICFTLFAIFVLIPTNKETEYGGLDMDSF